MKKILKTLWIVLFLLAVTEAKAQFISGELTAAGLTCSMCSKAIYNALIKLPFIEKVDVDLNKSSYSLLFKNQSTVSPDVIKQTVQKAGFSVASLKVKTLFKDVDVYPDAHLRLGETNLHFISVNKQKLNGTVDITIIDKGFLPDKKFIQFGKSTEFACFKTGIMAACCPNNKDGKADRIYHVTL